MRSLLILVCGGLLGAVAASVWSRRPPAPPPAAEYDPYAVPIGMPTVLPPQSLNWWLHRLGQPPQ